MKNFQYNKSYWDLMKSLNTRTGKIISKIRWDFVRDTKPSIVLDYGAGLNFLSECAPDGVTVDTFDVGDFPIKYTGIRHDNYDLIFLCDVLEHIPDHRILDGIFKKTKYVYISLPILPEGKKLRGWKHFKYETGEHLHYFTEKSLDLFFETRGFKKIKSGYPESQIRLDIYSALYEKEKIVFTNGVFDLLHSGHISLLKRAKELGDKLIIGLNSDKSAEKIKRKPILNQQMRKEMLESIKYVDEVIIFDDLNPERLIEKIIPDVLVKGGDYEKDEIIGAEFVEIMGGMVVVLPYLEGQSTTNLIKKIKSRSFINKVNPKDKK